MRKFYIIGCFLILGLLSFVSEINAQQKETFTGTVLSYGSGFNTRTRTANFTLDITGTTSDQKAQSLLNLLQERGQKSVLDEINNEELGRFSIGANVGIPVNVVRESIVDGKQRIFIVFERWTQFAEVRGGYRSLDYPFGVIELFIDPQTGKGEGTYIAAAKIRWDYDKDKKQYQVEIENFATYPARLLSVKRSNKNAR
jgi:hypothetical protein